MKAKDDDPEGDYHPSKLSDSAPRQNYADTPEYKKLLERIDKLDAENVALKETNERAEWTQKYSEVRVPAGRINVKDRVDFIMELPATKRQAYFDQSVKDVAGPATDPVHNEEPVTGTPTPGSDQESKAIRQLYEANRDVYRGDYAQAQRDYRAGKRAK
jgi:hypothetical protein